MWILVLALVVYGMVKFLDMDTWARNVGFGQRK